jgi:hypothetical protein
MTKPRKIRRLFLDLETSANIGLFWRAGYDQNIDAQNILKERAVICAAWKWAGDDKVYSLRWNSRQCDKKMLLELMEVVNSADEIVAHNGDKFDMPWLRTRLLFHGVSSFPTHKTIDTLQWCRRKFYFNSNKLDYVAQFLGLGSKLKTEFGLWKRVMQKDPKALNDMVKYCEWDVVLLEKVYDKLAGFNAPKTHAGVLNGGEKWSCPHCGSIRVKRNVIRVSAAGTVTHQMVCGRPRDGHTKFGCGRAFRISDSAYKAFLDR